MPIQINDSFGRQPAAMRDIERFRFCRRQIVDIVEQRREYFRGRNNPFGNTIGQAGERRLFAVHQEQAAPDRAAGRYPTRQFRSIGMARIFFEASDPRRDFDFIALNPHRLGALDQETPERALRLKPRQQHRGIALP